jgi:putative addiction module component (TIGR02574 family)
MSTAEMLAQIVALPLDERVELVEAIWTSIEAESAAAPLTDAQRQELERRLADHLAHPDDVIPWEEVKARVSN